MPNHQIVHQQLLAIQIIKVYQETIGVSKTIATLQSSCHKCDLYPAVHALVASGPGCWLDHVGSVAAPLFPPGTPLASWKHAEQILHGGVQLGRQAFSKKMQKGPIELIPPFE